MNDFPRDMEDPAGVALRQALGWGIWCDEQIDESEAALVGARVASVHRAHITVMTSGDRLRLTLLPSVRTTSFAVGDWVLVDPETLTVIRRLSPRTLLERAAEGSRAPQLIAANVDTLFIVTSCNQDFNLARLERYLALANQSSTTPVIVCTKADTSDEAARYVAEASALQRGLAAVALNALDISAHDVLAPWCQPGQTVALVGSSGVGKSTLLNTLAGPTLAAPQATGGVREDDAKGRHTTTSRSLHAIAGGGWVIDTPGMRSLQVSDQTYGLETLFAEITELAPNCRFRDCTHAHEPGCAVQAAVVAGNLDPDRLARWSKLASENTANTPVATGPKGASKMRKPTPPPGRKRR
jgi:ribosome biogenesis GTPase